MVKYIVLGLLLASCARTSITKPKPYADNGTVGVVVEFCKKNYKTNREVDDCIDYFL